MLSEVAETGDDDLTVEYLTGDDGRAAPPVVDSPGAAPRRSRRGLVIGLLVLLVAAGVAGALLIGPSPSGSDLVDNGLPAPGTTARSELDRAGFGGATGGSLARDAEALTQVRERVVELAALNGHAPASADEVVVLWAGDVGAGRYAGVLYGQGTGWSRVVLTGPAGSSPALLSEGSWDDERVGSGLALTDASATFVNRPFAPGTGAVLVIAPRARRVEIASARQFLPGGQVRTGWRPLEKQGGAVWVGAADESELYLANYRTTHWSEDRYPTSVDPVDDGAAALAIASGSAAGYESGKGVIVCAADQAREAGASLSERPVLARAVGVDFESTIGAVVLQSPDGGWVWGLCDYEKRPDSGGGTVQSEYTGAGISKESFSTADEVMAATPANLVPADESAEGQPRLIVLAPAGADHIRVGGVTAGVHGRLAEITLPWGTNLAGLKVDALRNGRLIGNCPVGA